MTDWYVGQRVGCLESFAPRPWVANLPVKGTIYTIRTICNDEMGTFLRFNELVNPTSRFYGGLNEADFVSSAFRPIDELTLDISVFERLLEPLNNREPVDA